MLAPPFRHAGGHMDVQLLPIEQVQLDYTNPRIARALEMFDPAHLNPDQIGLHLGRAVQKRVRHTPAFIALKNRSEPMGALSIR